ncbi:hypothetical protein ACFLR3_00200 [Campylobacterota bacterium]
MFDKEESFADAAIHLGITADLTENVSAGVSVIGVSTLGLENNLVSGTYSNAHTATTGTGATFLGSSFTQPLNLGGVSVDDELWVSEAWIAGTAFDTTLKAGRQAVDTPLAFTETWGIDKNTFEGAVLINQSIPDTTIVAAWLGKSNGSADDTAGVLNSIGGAAAGYVSEGGKFNTFAKDGAYAFGVINNSWKPLTAQAWAYDLQGLAKAYWVQADLDAEGVLAGFQYSRVDAVIDGYVDSNTYAVMAGYAMKDVVTVKAAFSKVESTDSLALSIGAANTATTSGQSKLYTEMWWNYGFVTLNNTEAMSLTAEMTVEGVDLLAGLYQSNYNDDILDAKMTELTVAASKSFGPLDATVAYSYGDLDVSMDNDTAGLRNKNHTLQVYLTYNF